MLRKTQITLRLSNSDLKALNALSTEMAGEKGSAFVGPTAVIRHAVKVALEASQGR